MIHGSAPADYLAFIIPDDFVKNGLRQVPFKLNCSKTQQENSLLTELPVMAVM